MRATSRLVVLALLTALPALTARAQAAPAERKPYFEFQVERPAVPLSDNPAPAYPADLRDARTEGTVLVQFVVDTLGQVVPGTLHVLQSTHPLFTQAVKDALPLLRFRPAEIGGRKVRQLVQQPFVFGFE